MIAKALPVNIYKHKGDDCSNGGISSRYNEILLLCDDGFINVDMDNPPENLCKVVKRNLWGRGYVHIEPIKEIGKDRTGYMHGGCVVSTSDSRFGRATGVDYPVNLHDRTETWQEYDMMSR